MYISNKKKLTLSNLFSEGKRDIFKYLPNSPFFSSSSGRGGIEYILNNLNFDKNEQILLPCFVAEGIVFPINKLNIDFAYYKLKKNLDVDLEDLKRLLSQNKHIKAIFVIHYFGYSQPIKSIKKICKKFNTILIEDCAQSLFSKNKDGKYLGSEGDISIFSLPKFLPVPDGSLFFFNNKNLFPQKINFVNSIQSTLSNLCHIIFLLLNSVNPKSNFSLKLINIISSKIYWNGYYRFIMSMPNMAPMSNFTRRLLTSFDYDSYINRKIENYKIIIDNISKNKIRNTVVDNVLMGFVMILDNRDDLLPVIKKHLNIDPLIFNGSTDFRGRWDYIPDKYDFPHEYRFVKNHCVFPIPDSLLDKKKFKKTMTRLNKLTG